MVAVDSIGWLAKLQEADMDMLFSLVQLLVLAGLGYGAWLCFLVAGKYDVESLRADIAASRAARTRGHPETVSEYPGVDQAGRISQSPVAWS